MRILAADTSTPVNTVAVVEDDRTLAESIVWSGRSHTERMPQTLEWVLSQAGVSLDALDLLAVSTGPGSFTGLRVGAAAWKGLAAGAGLPLIGVPTLDAMTRLIPFCDATVCVLLDAKMKEVFAGVYRFEGRSRTKVTGDRVCPIDEVLALLEGPVFFMGDGAVLYRDAILARVGDAVFVPELNATPRASAVAAEALDLARAGAATDPAAVVPVYLRRSQAEEARGKAGSS